MRKHIPNTLTCCNLISGCIAVTFALAQMPQLALCFIILGAIFDFFDGFAARLLGVSSPVGAELDSLSDVVTFGVAPSAMVFVLIARLLPAALPETMIGLQTYLPFVAFVMAAFSALRLAKFNLDTRQKGVFLGLPTPANALLWAGVVVGVWGQRFAAMYGLIAIGVGLLACCWLLVSDVPMLALKFKHFGWKGNAFRYVFLLLSLVVLVAVGHLALACALIVVLYISLSLLMWALHIDIR